MYSKRCASVLMLTVWAVIVSAAADPQLISETSIGDVRLGMTLQQVRTALPHARIARTTDGDGAALVEIGLAPGAAVIAWADEDDADAPIDWGRAIRTLETFSPRFHTAQGIHVGSRVAEVVRVYGPVREIEESEIESRQFITFERQPPGLTFRLDYSGIFAPGTHRTTRYQADAKIYSIAVSRNVTADASSTSR